MELMELQKAGLLVSGAIYVGSVLWLWRGLSGRRSGPALVRDRPSVSAIVAARNEETTLPHCLDALAGQDYQGAFEVIVVDDRSRDRTWDLIAAKAATWPVLKGVQAGPDGRFKCPKKSALAEGIEASSGEILLFTDADCRPPADWVRSMVAHFAPGVGLVAGTRGPIRSPARWPRSWLWTISGSGRWGRAALAWGTRCRVRAAIWATAAKCTTS